MMHAKNFVTTHSQFAAQAEIENKTKGKTQKAWWKAGKKGLNQLVRVGMLSFVCMLLMCLNGAGIYTISKFRLQPTEKFFGGNTAQICHQGQEARQTATRVSKTNTYSKQNFSRTQNCISTCMCSAKEALCNEKFLGVRQKCVTREVRNPHRHVVKCESTIK